MPSLSAPSSRQLRVLLLGAAAPGALLAPACSDQSLGRFNTAPEAAITSHVDGEEVLEAYPLTVRGAASDANDATTALEATWYLGDEVACPAAAPDADGVTTCVVAPTPGRSKLTLEVRDPDNAATSASLELAVVPTEAPTAAILQPLADGRYYADQKLTFEAAVDDAEDEPTALTLAWESDLDGPLALDGAPDSSGLVTTSGYLSAGQHAILLTVTDRSAKTATDQVIVSVGQPNTAPTCGILEPADSARVEAGAALPLSAWADDADQPPDTLRYSYTSSLDGLVAEGAPASDGGIEATWPAVGGGVHVLTLAVQDERGAVCSDAITLLVNQAPSAPVVDLVPDAASTGDDLGVVSTAPASDADGDALTYRTTWYRDGVEVPTWTSTTVPASATARGETWRVEVRASDGTAEGPPGSDEVTVQNSAPTLSAATLSPADPRTDDTVSLSVSSADADGDAVAVDVDWYVSGSLVAASGTTLAGTTWFDKGDTVQAVVTVSDADAAGDTLATDLLTVQNTPPQATAVSLSPTAAYTNSTLTASVVATDADGDALAYSYAWWVGGAAVAASGSTLSGATWFDKGDTVQVQVTPDDGEATGDPLHSAALTVLNSPPGAPSVAIDPSAPLEGVDELWCEVVVDAADADGDAVTYSFAWEVDGAPYTGAEATEHEDDTVPSDATAAGEEWTCTVAADDGEDAGGTDADTVTIGAGDVDYTGLWDLDSTIRYSCAFGYVAIDFDQLYVEDEHPDITVTSSSSAQPGTMSGSFPTASSFIALRSIPGTCTETYQVSGIFVDEDTIEGTFTATFSGGAWCFDCASGSWDFTATR